jgi:hypothetical protein
LSSIGVIIIGYYFSKLGQQYPTKLANIEKWSRFLQGTNNALRGRCAALPRSEGLGHPLIWTMIYSPKWWCIFLLHQIQDLIVLIVGISLPRHGQGNKIVLAFMVEMDFFSQNHVFTIV